MCGLTDIVIAVRCQRPDGHAEVPGMYQFVENAKKQKSRIDPLPRSDSSTMPASSTMLASRLTCSVRGMYLIVGVEECAA